MTRSRTESAIALLPKRRCHSSISICEQKIVEQFRECFSITSIKSCCSCWVVQPNSHISFQKCYYSVPYRLIGKEVNLKIQSESLDIYDDHTQLTTHKLLTGEIGVYFTDIAHLPDHSTQFSEWNSHRYLNRAKKKGPFTEQVIRNLFSDAPYEQKAYRTVHAILKLADLTSDQRLESTCQFALENISQPSYKHLKSILANNQDQTPKRVSSVVSKGAFVRGGEYYGK